jgi:hypothetical protein
MSFKIIKNKKENISNNNIESTNISFLNALLEDNNKVFSCKNTNTHQAEKKQTEGGDDSFFNDIFNDSQKELIKNQVSDDLDGIINDIKLDKPKSAENTDSSRIVDRRKRR